MPYTPDKTTFTAAKLDAILLEAANLSLQPPPDGKKPLAIKAAAVAATLDAIRVKLRDDLEFVIRGVLNFHTVVNGSYEEAEDKAAWLADANAAVRAELDPLRELLSDKVFDRITDDIALQCPGIDFDMADALAHEYTLSIKPLPMHGGKWLAAFGITQPMLDVAEHNAKLYGTIDPATQTVPPPLPVAVRSPVAPPPAAPTASVEFDEDALYAPIAAPPAPPASTLIDQPGARATLAAPPPPPPPPGGAPDEAALQRAFALWNENGGPKLDDMARLLGMSPSTLRNRCHGRTSGKLSRDQARMIASDIDRRVAQLQDAATIFAAVR